MRDFVDYIASIAPEGETTLIVKQSPKLVDGKQQFHTDGAVKCTWPAFLPAQWKSGAAWYGNTASFIIDRFVSGKPSASAAACDRVAFLLLDDVGTKSKTPPEALVPTWIIETSPGNFQWGFTFALDDQPLKAEYAAAIKAIAAAGYTDPGSINPVRNFRIPGSPNLKPGLNKFEAKLVVLNRHSEHSLTSICAALGVVPEVADTSVAGSRLRVEDDGKDDVLLWLREQGLIAEERNAEGWLAVQCPNAKTHSDGSPTGRYLPVNRAFTCFHSHCGDWTSARFLTWVEDQGGPQAVAGLRSELLAITMTEALSKLRKGLLFTEATEAEVVIAEVERKELSRVQKEDWYSRFAYIESEDAYFDLQDRREVSRATFNALYRHVGCKSIHSDRRVEASICFDENRQAKKAPSLAEVTYAAGDSVIVARDGLRYGNKWIDARPAPVRGDVSLWLQLAERLIPDPVERNHVLDVFAFKLQNPRVKINHAILHAGAPGIGKDTFYAGFLWAIGGPDSRNVALVRNEDVMSQWGYALQSEVMVINELRQADISDRRALENTLKPLIAAPPKVLSVTRKRLHPYDAVNRLLLIAFSNERAAIALPTSDRRWFVLWSHSPKLTQEESQTIWGWYENGGFAAVAGWLKDRNVAHFRPAAPPQDTEDKAILIERSRNAAEEYAFEQIISRSGDFAKGVIASPFHPICDRMMGLAPNGVRITPASLFLALTEARWIDRGRVYCKEYQTKKQIYASPDLNSYSSSDLRRMVEEAPQSTLMRVK